LHLLHWMTNAVIHFKTWCCIASRIKINWNLQAFFGWQYRIFFTKMGQRQLICRVVVSKSVFVSSQVFVISNFIVELKALCFISASTAFFESYELQILCLHTNNLTDTALANCATLPNYSLTHARMLHWFSKTLASTDKSTWHQNPWENIIIIIIISAMKTSNLACYVDYPESIQMLPV
jgi:hypothetical protein